MKNIFEEFYLFKTLFLYIQTIILSIFQENIRTSTTNSTNRTKESFFSVCTHPVFVINYLVYFIYPTSDTHLNRWSSFNKKWEFARPRGDTGGLVSRCSTPVWTLSLARAGLCFSGSPRTRPLWRQTFPSPAAVPKWPLGRLRGNRWGGEFS